MYGYPQYTTPFMGYNRTRNGFDEQMANLGQTPPIQQNFITPSFVSDFDAKWVNSLEEAKGMFINRDTIFINRNDKTFYLRKTDGELKKYKFEEIIDLDEKDLRIKELEEKLKKYENGDVSNDDESNRNT